MSAGVQDPSQPKKKKVQGKLKEKPLLPLFYFVYIFIFYKDDDDEE